MLSTHTQDKTNPLKPAIAGVAIGAVVAAGAVLMSDKKKRKQVMDTMSSMKDKTNHVINQAKNKVDELRDSIDDLQEDAEDMLDDASAAKRKLK